MSNSVLEGADRVANDQRSKSPTHNRWAIKRQLVRWSRLVHIYLSLFGLAAILFFSVTGLTLNHPDWFFEESITQLNGSVSTDWLNNGATPPADWDESDYSYAIDKLPIAEHLRAEHSLCGTVSDFLAFEDECEVTFQGPGYAAVARINRQTGEYTVDVAANDFVTVINDLHKGRHSGSAWKWIIDVSAIIGVLVAITGFILIFFLKLHRTAGLVTAAIGSIAITVFFIIATC